jgi:hypothetical protein
MHVREAEGEILHYSRCKLYCITLDYACSYVCGRIPVFSGLRSFDLT